MSADINPATDPASILATISGLTEPQFRTIKSSELGRIFFVEAREGWFVLRLPARANLGINRAQEFQVHRALATAGLAPEIQWCNPVSGGLLTEWQTGGIWRKQIDEAQDLIVLAELLERVHAQKISVSQLHYESRLQHYLQQAVTYFDREALAPIRQAVVDLTHFLSGIEPRLGLCHHDPLRPNIVCVNDRPLLIDWEYAAVGDVRFDLAAICLDNELDSARRETLTVAYGHGLKPDELRPFELLCRLTDALWYGAQGEPMVMGSLLEDIRKTTS